MAALTWDLGGLAYEMAIRDHYRLDVLARKAAELQEADAQLASCSDCSQPPRPGSTASAARAAPCAAAAQPSAGAVARRCMREARPSVPPSEQNVG